MKSRSFLIPTLCLAAVSLSACTNDELSIDEGDTAATSDALIAPLAFTAITDRRIDPSVKPESLVITSQSAYRRHFGHRAANVDFTHEWVAYYSAGLQTSDGDVASVVSIDGTDHLSIVTALTSPGAGCETHAQPEVPYVLVKFARPSERPCNAAFTHRESLRDCSAPTPPPGPVATDCASRKGGAMVTIENVDDASERVTTWVTDADFIDEARRLIAAGERKVPTFKVLDGTDCDAQWSFHLDPVDAHFADFAIEVCDAVPSYLQQNKGEWLAKNLRWCPWSAHVIEVDDRR